MTDKSRKKIGAQKNNEIKAPEDGTPKAGKIDHYAKIQIERTIEEWTNIKSSILEMVGTLLDTEDGRACDMWPAHYLAQNIDEAINKEIM